MDIVVNKKNAGKRLDKFLKKEVFFNEKITRGEIIRQIKNRNILVNGKKVKPSYILKENDVVTEHITRNLEQKLIPNSKIKLEIIYQDKNIIVVNKPAGLQAHPDFHEKNNTLVNALIAKFPEIKNVGDEPGLRPGIVHRLDKDTSGIIVIARNQKIFLELKNKFKNREIKKKYWAVVWGKLMSPGIIDKPLARATNYRKQVIAGKKTKTKTRKAVTEYKIIKIGNDFSLLEVFPKTGRTHQIRVHLASIDHPIVGDKLYKLKRAKSNTGASRQLLHAKSLEFELGGRGYSFSAEIPPEFKQFLANLD